MHLNFFVFPSKKLRKLISCRNFAMKVRSRQGDLTTFDECVEKNQPDCDPKVRYRYLYSAFYLCFET
jgi:hypothetical protein